MVKHLKTYFLHYTKKNNQDTYQILRHAYLAKGAQKNSQKDCNDWCIIE